jgi:hypothetical protein
MKCLRAFVLAAAWVATPALAGAQSAMPMATADPTQAPLTSAEQTFVTQASAAVQQRYATIAAAQAAGYRRYTNEDRTGAISYVNPAYMDSPDVAHPQQLWYDVNGRLLGGDWSQTVATAPNGPTLFGLQPSRFHRIPLHIHYVVKRPDGSFDYGLYVRASDFTAAGLDPLHPTAADLVKLGKVPSADRVALVFALLANWDAQMWVIPNAAGPFNDSNPAVKPSPDQGKRPAERQT